MKEITLTNSNQVALVDDHNYDRVRQFKWRLYSVRFVGMTTEPNMTLHKFIMGDPNEGYEWDHKDRNILNNQEHNLRLATHSQNLSNRGKQKGLYSSAFKGVSWYSNNKKWRAQIKVRGKLIFLGYFEVETDAAKAYDSAALEHFGEFSVTNFTVIGKST